MTFPREGIGKHLFTYYHSRAVIHWFKLKLFPFESGFYIPRID